MENENKNPETVISKSENPETVISKSENPETNMSETTKEKDSETSDEQPSDNSDNFTGDKDLSLSEDSSNLEELDFDKKKITDTYDDIMNNLDNCVKDASELKAKLENDQSIDYYTKSYIQAYRDDFSKSASDFGDAFQSIHEQRKKGEISTGKAIGKGLAVAGISMIESAGQALKLTSNLMDSISRKFDDIGDSLLESAESGTFFGLISGIAGIACKLASFLTELAKKVTNIVATGVTHLSEKAKSEIVSPVKSKSMYAQAISKEVERSTNNIKKYNEQLKNLDKREIEECNKWIEDHKKWEKNGKQGEEPKQPDAIVAISQIMDIKDKDGNIKENELMDEKGKIKPEKYYELRKNDLENKLKKEMIHFSCLTDLVNNPNLTKTQINENLANLINNNPANTIEEAEKGLDNWIKIQQETKTLMKKDDKAIGDHNQDIEQNISHNMNEISTDGKSSELDKESSELDVNSKLIGVKKETGLEKISTNNNTVKTLVGGIKKKEKNQSLNI